MFHRIKSDIGGRVLATSFAALAAALLCSGCTPFAVKAPEGFVKLEKTRLSYKAVSADGAA